MPFRKEKKIPFYMQNLNKIFPLLLHLSLTAFTSCRKVTQSFSNPENCYDITRQLASFKAIKFTKRYRVSESVSDKHSQRSLHLPGVWRPFPAVERLHNHFPTQKTVTTSQGSWHHSKPSSLLNVTEWVSQWVSESVSEWVSYWQALPMIGLGSDKNNPIED